MMAGVILPAASDYICYKCDQCGFVFDVDQCLHRHRKTCLSKLGYYLNAGKLLYKFYSRFLLSGKTSYQLQDYFQPHSIWHQKGINSERSKSLQPKESNWHRLNSIIEKKYNQEIDNVHFQTTKDKSEEDTIRSTNPKSEKNEYEDYEAETVELNEKTRSGDDTSELSVSLKGKIADAVFGVRRKERGRVDRDSGIFSSGSDTPERRKDKLEIEKEECLNEKDSEESLLNITTDYERQSREESSSVSQPSLRIITRQKNQRRNQQSRHLGCTCMPQSDLVVKKVDSVINLHLPTFPSRHTREQDMTSLPISSRGYSLERGLDRRRQHKSEHFYQGRQVFKHWSASPTNSHIGRHQSTSDNRESSLGQIRSSRLDKIAYCHHIPRVSPARSLPPERERVMVRNGDMNRSRIRYQGHFLMEDSDLERSRPTKSPSDSGQDSLSDDSDSSSDLLCFTSSSSVAEEEGISIPYIQEKKIMHSYIASRGQREREMDIYEVQPPATCEV